MKNNKCPICGEHHEYLIKAFHSEVDQPILDLLSDEVPDWRAELGACTRCIDQAQLELQLSILKAKEEPAEINGYKILPIPTRLLADTKQKGKGVTICIIDSGFYLHPDLIFPKNRILKILDITQPDRDESYFTRPHNNSWHGTMTSVICTGNGHLSGGMYRGLASEANLVLIKVSDENGAISGNNIAKALQWAVENSTQYNIKIINLSVTDDFDIPHKKSQVDQAVEHAVKKGISVVAASGNNPDAPVLPPANSPYAITVGGLNDRNTLDPLLNTLYHSTFGETVDRFQKPDIIAPAIWLAAPILPNTKEQREAEALFDLYYSDDKFIKAKLANLLHKTSLSKELLFQKTAIIKEAISHKINDAKYISPHYQHADGTSFAAPIICSVIAQMLEVNPLLDPYTVREILFITARHIPGEKAERQGWGVIRPGHAVQMAAGNKLKSNAEVTPIVDYRNMVANFFINCSYAQEVVLTGDFINWRKEGVPMQRSKNGNWKTNIKFNNSGIYRYKFLIDKKEWTSDPRNLYRENDGFNGFNSKLIIL
ncbi:MAG: S8 family serine peptidase [Saprospiraceae bacterium]